MQQVIFQARKSVCGGMTTIRKLSQFKVIEHVVPCSHTRQRPGGAEPGHHNDLKLAVKQYVPLDYSSSSPTTNDVTLIGAAANAFPKELYEPMWEDINDRLREKGKSIRSIWIADVATQGQSGVLNETILGTDSNWYDHARDLMFLINQKQGEMPQPLIGVGHSMGALHLVSLSLMHPSLLQALVLIDPTIQTENPGLGFAPLSTYRRDTWPSREEAVTAFRKSKFYQKWDPRVLDKWLEYGLRELPTELYPDAANNENGKVSVTLTTTKRQELIQYLRPLYMSDPKTDKELYADFDPGVLEDSDRFYRPEPRAIFYRLPELLPPIHYIFGAESVLATPELRRKKMETTGTGIGGNGGAAAGRVTETVLDCGHLVSMEKTQECAIATADFINRSLDEYVVRKEKFEKQWQTKTRHQRIDVDDDWKRNIGPPPERPKKPSNL